MDGDYLLISAIKLIVPIGIMLLCNTVAPPTANALLLSDSDSDGDGDGDGMFLPVLRELFPTSYDSMNTSISSPNRVQVFKRSIFTFTPIQHQLFAKSHLSMNTSISSPNSIQFLKFSFKYS
jgi:hypothetical protein